MRFGLDGPGQESRSPGPDSGRSTPGLSDEPPTPTPRSPLLPPAGTPLPPPRGAQPEAGPPAAVAQPVPGTAAVLRLLRLGQAARLALADPLSFETGPVCGFCVSGFPVFFLPQIFC